MTVKPTRDGVFVELERDLPGGPNSDVNAIVVVRAGTPPAWRGTVRAVGPDCRDTRVGQRVVVSRLQGIEVAGGVLLPEAAVLATLAPEPPPPDDDSLPRWGGGYDGDDPPYPLNAAAERQRERIERGEKS